LVLFGCNRLATPKLEILDPATDLGAIRTEDLQQKLIRIRNAGSAPLKIRDVQVSCGCTRPDFPKEVGPGATAEIKVDYQPDLLASGKKTETLTIQSNDPANPSAKATLTAELQPPLVADQKKPLAVTFTPGKQKVVTIHFTPREPGPPPITSVECKDPRVVVGLRSDRGVSEVAVIVGTSPGAGDYDASLLLRTTLENSPIVEFPIVAQTQEGPFSFPPVVYVEQLKQAGTRLAILSIMCRGGKVKVTSVLSHNPAIEAKVDRSGEGKTWIAITYKGGLKPGALTTAVQINTDHSKWPILMVPVVIKSFE
jgi:hypothetical protein